MWRPSRAAASVERHLRQRGQHIAAPVKLLVVANRTVDSDEMFEAVVRRCGRSGCSVTLLVPASWEVQDPHGGRESARRRLKAATTRLRGAGLEVEYQVGDPDPEAAVKALWDPSRFDEVIVCTLPTAISNWLKRDLPHRVERITRVPVTHVIASERSVAVS
jgi:hypothetical protein